MNDPITAQSIALASLRAVQLCPGDVVVLTFPDALSPRLREHWLGVLDSVFPEHESMLLENGADLSILRAEQPERPKVRPFPRQKAAHPSRRKVA